MSWFSELRDQAVSVLDQVDRVAAENLRKEQRRALRNSRQRSLPSADLKDAEDGLAEVNEDRSAQGSASQQSPRRQHIKAGFNSKEGRLATAGFQTGSERDTEHLELMEHTTSTTSLADGGGALTPKRKAQDMLQGVVKSLEEEIASLSQRLADAQASEADAAKRASKAEHAAESAAAKARAAERQAHTAQTLANRLKADNAALDDERASLESKIAQLKQDQRNYQEAQTRVVDTLKRKIQDLEDSLAQTESSSSEQGADLQASVAALKDRLASTESQLQQSRANISRLTDELQQERGTVQQLRDDLHSSQRDFNEYKLRAARILANRDRVILQLKSGEEPVEIEENAAETSTPQVVDDVEAELSHARIAALETRIQELEEQQQADADWADQQFRELETALAAEQKRSSELERELKAARHEASTAENQLLTEKHRLLSEKQELQHQVEDLKAQVAQVNSRQLQAPSSDAASTARVDMLTETLLQRQVQIESLTAEASSLRFQLDAERRKHQQELSEAKQAAATATQKLHEEILIEPIVPPTRVISTNRLEKNLKHAATVLDSLSIRLAIVLRRYPAVRLLVIFYVIVLHLWVMFILISYQPEMHNLDPESEPHPVYPAH